MLDYTDKKWSTLTGGYQIIFNASNTLIELENNPSSEVAWKAIWENLHHQGDIGEASYAVIPNLIDIHQRKFFSDWQIYSYVSLIMIESHRKSNLPVPDWIQQDYTNSLKILFKIALTQLEESQDKLLTRSIIGFICLYKNLIKYGAIISYYDESELNEIINDLMAWNELYKC